MEDIILTFKEKKLKLTPQRLAVYQYLKSTREHPSAETIYKALQPNYPTMSLATVYKTLILVKAILDMMGIVVNMVIYNVLTVAK